MILNLSSLECAISQLEESLEFYHSDLAKDNAKLRVHLRAAAIQAFEFTYELSIRTLKRFLENTEPNPSSIDEMTFNELIRLAYERGVLRFELSRWKEFRKDRGTTSHAYNEAKAIDVFDSIPDFLSEAKFLRAEIERRQQLTSEKS